jgi:hypothetical protein
VTRRPLISQANPAKAGKDDHVRQHQHGDSGDDGHLDVVTGLFESDDDK